MSLYVFDTDILTLFQKGHAAVVQRARTHSPDDLAVTVLTVEEQLSGWYTRLRKVKDTATLARVYQELASSVKVLADLRILSFTEPAIMRYRDLKAQKVKVRKMDLRIAAVVLENGGTFSDAKPARFPTDSQSAAGKLGGVSQTQFLRPARDLS